MLQPSAVLLACSSSLSDSLLANQNSKKAEQERAASQTEKVLTLLNESNGGDEDNNYKGECDIHGLRHELLFQVKVEGFAYRSNCSTPR